MPYQRVNYAVLLASLCAVASTAGCATAIPQDVKEGKRLPDTLEMCHAMLVDANDKNYLLQLEIKHSQENNK